MATAVVETDSVDTTPSIEIPEEDQENTGTSLADSTVEEIAALEQRLLEPVSYTHLDVYKRQSPDSLKR